jgi:hypothetical protein
MKKYIESQDGMTCLEFIGLNLIEKHTYNERANMGMGGYVGTGKYDIFIGETCMGTYNSLDTALDVKQMIYESLDDTSVFKMPQS